MTVRGTVKGNTIVLDDGACLPEGATVEVRLLPEPAISREEAFAAVLKHREQNRGLRVGMDEIIEEEKQDREERVDSWLSPDR
jgi:hypothetical protein